jgi:hypothetical protein
MVFCLANCFLVIDNDFVVESQSTGDEHWRIACLLNSSCFWLNNSLAGLREYGANIFIDIFDSVANL